MKFRVYGKEIQQWQAVDEKGRTITLQMEVAYKEYDSETGQLLAAGTEDFSPVRWSHDVAERWLYTWDGSKRNKGGYRWFEDHGQVKVRKSDIKAYKRYLLMKYNAAEVQLR